VAGPSARQANGGKLPGARAGTSAGGPTRSDPLIGKGVAEAEDSPKRAVHAKRSSALKTTLSPQPDKAPISHSFGPELDRVRLSRKAAGRAPRILYETEGFLVAKWENVTIVIWGKQGSLELCEKLDEVSAPLRLEHPEGGSAIHIVADAPLPDADVREKLADISRRYGDQLACVGAVLEGSGFWASTLQSFIITILSFGHRSFKVNTCSTVAEMARWLPPLHAKRTGVTFTPQELERVLTSLRLRVR
jgi:hypothetical protein